MKSLLYGLILAGGKSRRIGQDKAKILFSGQTFLHRSFSIINSYVSDVFVSVREDQKEEPERAAFNLIIDRQSELGPAAGLIAAHRTYPEAAWLVVACDMPHLTSDDIALIIGERDDQMDATAFLNAGQIYPEPLCAIYEPGTLDSFTDFVRRGGSSSPKLWLHSADTHLITPISNRALQSINTAKDLKNLNSLG
ncbi:MAG: NTP transferase domain-containing protein [Pseudomonadota bacterium]|nr:NTP transferase domain-containing protein [Pseudomonadota bacterium]